jgi:predicted secreted protein
MDIGSGIMIYFLIWWTVIFCILPFGVRRNTAEFEGSGAPANPDLKKKFLITTGVSCLVWLFVYGAVTSGMINFRDVSMKMIEENHND